MMDRRTVVKGASWAAPVIVTAALAPTLAASTVNYSITGRGDKCPGISDVPGGWPKHGYRVVLNVTPSPSDIAVTHVILGNGKAAKILTSPINTGNGWEFVVDADSSPSKLTVFVIIDGIASSVEVKTFPRCD